MQTIKLFLDTEFNSFGGCLISIALVTEDLEYAYYSEVTIPDKTVLHPWVKENVIAKLQGTPIAMSHTRNALANYLNRLTSGKATKFEVIADWPEDIKHFCDLICDTDGRQLSFPFQFNLVNRNSALESSNPHNALDDAVALRNWYVKSMSSRAFD
jgi:hypothetical protein